ncbi:hypothetical protein [Rhodococcus sp. LB1]|uniref:hypothetical protein n=1 Tax=Rhodococcus sp. LB1 TaxID=1807499 RepID=UPI00077A71A1|nr:hypothetical protein [Rhodococcus sp. LB1]KXX62133.1 hypothetical protein AZG88_31020 [Rhodococcus sp. LB1]
MSDTTINSEFVTGVIEFEPDTDDSTETETAMNHTDPAALTGDDAVRADYDAAMARRVQGTTADNARKGAAEYAERERQRAQERERRTAAAGGGEVATALRGEIGEAVTNTIRLDRIAESARKLEHRVTEERREAEAAMRLAARAEHLDTVLADGWTAAESKAKVPAILTPHIEFVDDVQHVISPSALADTVTKRIREQHAGKARQRVRDVLAEVDTIVMSAAQDVLEKAGNAADTLTAAGLTPDASAESVIENGGSEVLTAWKAWKRAVEAWSDIQSARRWVAVAVQAGFDPRKPERLAPGDHDDIEAASWWGQWVGVRVLAVSGAHESLRWWVENKRPAPAGVADEIKGEGSK